MSMSALPIRDTACVPTTYLAEILQDARARTLDLVCDLDDEQLMGPRLPIVNPLLWEIGHVAWFHERWILRQIDGREPLRSDADALYDSIAIAHERRWDLPLPSREDTLSYMARVQDALLTRLRGSLASTEESYYYQLTVFHEDMHGEAFVYTRQTLGYPRPSSAHDEAPGVLGGGALPGDVDVPGGIYLLGALPGTPFVFDNEKWAHPVRVEDFRISRAPVTNAEFAAFVDDGGYRRRDLWSEDGWRWRQGAAAERPVYWVCEAGGKRLKCFDQTFPLRDNQPVSHVNWYEAEAYCRWAGRRLPTEAEWELAASAEPSDDGRRFTSAKRRFPWGNPAPTAATANLDGWALGCSDVAALAGGDSAVGCRQMIGNVWEWTATDFAPYPGFVPDAYEEYSAPWFYTRKVLRGGSWATRARLLRNTWRNFFSPERRDVIAGFRTCALRGHRA